MDERTEPGRSMRLSIYDVAAYGVMAGLTGPYIAWYAKGRAAGDTFIGFLDTVPLVLGSLMQVLAARWLIGASRRRPYYVVGSWIQASMWLLALSTILLADALALPVFFLAILTATLALSSTIPPWYSTMGDMVPHAIRGSYFSARNRVMFTGQVLAIIGGGLCLKVLGTMTGYALLFGGAFVARSISAFYGGRMTEPALRDSAIERVRPLQYVGILKGKNIGRFVCYIATFTFALNFSGPYVVIYMKDVLHLTDWQYMLTQVTFLGGYILQLRTWGRLSDRYGNRRVQLLCGAGAVLIPFLWLAAGGLPWVLFLHLFAGFFWSGFELCTTNFLLDSVSSPRRAAMIAYQNLTVGIAALLGSAAGALTLSLLKRHGTDIGLSPFLVLFLGSFLMRFAVQMLLAPRYKEEREVQSVGFLDLLKMALHVKRMEPVHGPSTDR